MSDASIRVMTLLDDLEEILANASKVPFSEKAIVDSDEIRSIVDDIRLSMPKDIQQAKWVKDEQDRILNEARGEYDKVIIAAKKQAEYLVENDIIKKEAEKRAEFSQPMNDYFTDLLGEMNGRVKRNRQEMKALAERIQGGASYSEGQQTAPEAEEEEQ